MTGGPGLKFDQISAAMQEWYSWILLSASLLLILGFLSFLYAFKLYGSGGKPFIALLAGFFSCAVGIIIAGNLSEVKKTVIADFDIDWPEKNQLIS